MKKRIAFDDLAPDSEIFQSDFLNKNQTATAISWFDELIATDEAQ